jgi:uncharacterized membrane protein
MGTAGGMLAVSGGHSTGIFLAIAVFLACAVEMVEALTIVVAVGTTRGWRISLAGAGAAVVTLGVLVVAFGPALIHFIPLDALRIIIGLALLYFGFGWLRKAILRAAGRKAKHDEDAIYARTVKEIEEESEEAASGGRSANAAAFIISFKGVFLEGLEVVIIVLTLGGAAHNLALASAAAGVALVVVTVAGVMAARPLSRVPENTMKFTVGLMLMTFGTFWLGEGLGLDWPGADASLLWLLAAYGLGSWGTVRLLSRSPATTSSS